MNRDFDASEHFEVPNDHTPKKVDERHRCDNRSHYNSRVRRHDIGACCQSRRCHWFRFWVSYRFSGILLSALSLLPAATTSTLLLTSRLSTCIGPITRRVSANGWLSTVRIIFYTGNHVHTPARLDRRTRSILPGVQVDPGCESRHHRKVRDRLPRCERSMADRQLTADQILSALAVQ